MKKSLLRCQSRGRGRPRVARSRAGVGRELRGESRLRHRRHPGAAGALSVHRAGREDGRQPLVRAPQPGVELVFHRPLQGVLGDAEAGHGGRPGEPGHEPSPGHLPLRGGRRARRQRHLQVHAAVAPERAGTAGSGAERPAAAVLAPPAGERATGAGAAGSCGPGGARRGRRAGCPPESGRPRHPPARSGPARGRHDAGAGRGGRAARGAQESDAAVPGGSGGRWR